MFKQLEGAKLVWMPLTIHIPQDGGGFTKARMKIQFEIASNSDNQARMERFQAGDPDTDWLNDVVKGWEQYVKSDGITPVEFNEQELHKFLDVPYVRIAVITEYFNAANGGVGRRKN